MKKVKDFITRDLTSITEDATLMEVAEIISWRELSGIPVVNSENEVIGFISEKDLITAIFPEKVKIEDPSVIGVGNLAQIVKRLSQVGKAIVKDYMSPPATNITEDTPAADVVEIMLNKNLKRMPVVRNKKLVGVVDRTSLCRMLLEEGEL